MPVSGDAMGIGFTAKAEAIPEVSVFDFLNINRAAFPSNIASEDANVGLEAQEFYFFLPGDIGDKGHEACGLGGNFWDNVQRRGGLIVILADKRARNVFGTGHWEAPRVKGSSTLSRYKNIKSASSKIND